MTSKPKNPIPIYQLKIMLCDINPPVVRILQIKGNATLSKLHDCIQGAMGWKNSHLHQFTIKGKIYRPEEQMPEDIDDTEIFDEGGYRLNKLLEEGDTFFYEYDFGDCWEHEICVENILPAQEDGHYPICIYGERACPPEDCGGVDGYEYLLDVLNDPDHEEYEDYSEWAGEDFDPEAFDLKITNSTLSKIKSRNTKPKGNWM